MIVLGDDMRDRILAKGVAPERVVVVRDGRCAPRKCRPAAIPSSRKFVAGFRSSRCTPGIWDFTALGTRLLKAAEILRNENTGLVFIGDGANRAALAARGARFAECSFLAVSASRADSARDGRRRRAHRHGKARAGGRRGARASCIRFSQPGVRCSLCAAQKCDAARIVVESGCGLAADPDDPAAVAAAIRELRSTPRAWQKWAAARGKQRPNMLELNELKSLLAISGRRCADGSPRPRVKSRLTSQDRRHIASVTYN